MNLTKSKLIIASLTTLILVVISYSFKQETKSNKYLLIKTLEMYNIYDGSYLWIIDETGKSEGVKMEKYKPSNVLTNTIKLTEEINKVAAKGYELVSSSSSAADGFSSNTYVFVKK